MNVSLTLDRIKQGLEKRTFDSVLIRFAAMDLAHELPNMNIDTLTDFVERGSKLLELALPTNEVRGFGYLNAILDIAADFKVAMRKPIEDQMIFDFIWKAPWRRKFLTFAQRGKIRQGSRNAKMLREWGNLSVATAPRDNFCFVTNRGKQIANRIVELLQYT